MGGPNDAAQRIDATAMALGTRQAARCRPAPVSVHDDRHMQRTGSIRSFRGGGGGVRHHLKFQDQSESNLKWRSQRLIASHQTVRISFSFAASN